MTAEPGPDRRLVVASRNPGKIAEFARLLAGLPVDVIGLDEAGVSGDLEEPHDSYADNASAKAEQACAVSGLPTLADDSGIEVLALDGWPGPQSARWMGPDADDRDRLLGLLAEVERRSPDDRRVRYVAAIALARPEAGTLVAHGTCSGVLVEPSGEGGFGYDPSFLSDDLGITFGNAAQADKDRVSHRARALRTLIGLGVLSHGAGPTES